MSGRSGENQDPVHEWRRGPVMGGNPTMVCIACDLVWRPHQRKPDDRSCATRQDRRGFRRPVGQLDPIREQVSGLLRAAVSGSNVEQS